MTGEPEDFSEPPRPCPESVDAAKTVEMDGPPPRPDGSMDFESVAVIAATPALLELLAPKPSEPAMAEVEVQAATFGFKVKAQTYPTGNRHVVCMCSQCEGARYGLEPGGSHVL